MANNRNIWLFGDYKPITKNKEKLCQSYFRYMLSRTLRMFEYTGLPETLPQRELELILQTCSFVIITKRNGDLFAFYGGLGGQPNEYYQPTQAIVSNPYLKFSAVLNLDDYIKDDGNAVLMWNDSAHIGLYPMFSKYSELIAECDISLKYLLINKRFMNVLTADDDNTKESIKDMFESVEDGTGYGIVVTKQFIDDSSINTLDIGKHANTDLKDVMEIKQYLLASWYNELGLNANYNMKRESINESEADLNEDALLPLIDDMLHQRELAVESINKKFGTEIKVELSSAWKKLREEIIQRERLQDAEIDVVENQAEEQPSEEPQPEENEDDAIKD